MATVEQYTNLAQDTLSAGIDDNDLLLTLNDASEFPTEGNFRIRIDAELILVTAVSGDTFTITRGIESTVAASHSSGATVTHVLTAGAVPEIFRRHVVSARVTHIDSDDFTQNNFGSSTVTTQDGIISFRSPISSQQVHQLLKTLPAAPYTLTYLLWFNAAGSGISGGGPLLRESGTGKMVSIALCGDNLVRLQKWNGNTSFNSLYTDARVLETWQRYGKPLYIQIEDNSTNRIFRISDDGVNYEQMLSVLNTDFLTPNQYGLMIDPEGTGDDRILTCYDLRVE